jgi:NADH-quinone oxidoreductase subunit L
MVTPDALLRWMVFLPALGFLWNAIVGNRAPRTSAIVGPGAVGGAFIVAVISVLRLHGLEGGHEHAAPMLRDLVWNWITVGGFSADVAFRLDAISAIMVLVVTGIGFLIHVYSIGYMHGDASFARFFTYLNLFITAMLVLVLGDNLPLLFVGWEGVGSCSYLLIGFWYEVEANAVAGKKAFIVNRVGDASFVLGLFLLVQHAGTLDVAMLQEKAPELAKPRSAAGAPDRHLPAALRRRDRQVGADPALRLAAHAMAGPTPVSALIHAATMVTAGVYMVTRLHSCSCCREAAPALAVIAWVGALTVRRRDDRDRADRHQEGARVPTVSQRSATFRLGVGDRRRPLFHVVTHAFF